MPYEDMVNLNISNLDFSIEVEYSEDLLNVEGFEEELESAMQKTANEARDFWYSEAGKRLKSSRSDYQNAISVENVSSDGFSVSLNGGFLPWAVEMGTSSYQMNIKRGQVYPLNVNREPVLSNPIFRTGTGEPVQHPGFEGVKISEDVLSHIADELLPKYIDQALEKL